MSAPSLTGYRPEHAALLRGAWLDGELLCFSRNEARAPDQVKSAPEPVGRLRERLLVIPGLAFARFTDVEPVHRRARVEIGIESEFDPAKGTAVLASVLETAFDQLNLERIFGWVRSSHPPTHELLREAGFVPEVKVPRAVWVRGDLVERQLWGVLRKDCR